jgi:hypothetical protein
LSNLAAEQLLDPVILQMIRDGLFTKPLSRDEIGNYTKPHPRTVPGIGSAFRKKWIESEPWTGGITPVPAKKKKPKEDDGLPIQPVAPRSSGIPKIKIIDLGD